MSISIAGNLFGVRFEGDIGFRFHTEILLDFTVFFFVMRGETRLISRREISRSRAETEGKVTIFSVEMTASISVDQLRIVAARSTPGIPLFQFPVNKHSLGDHSILRAESRAENVREQVESR